MSIRNLMHDITYKTKIIVYFHQRIIFLIKILKISLHSVYPFAIILHTFCSPFNPVSNNSFTNWTIINEISRPAKFFVSLNC